MSENKRTNSVNREESIDKTTNGIIDKINESSSNLSKRRFWFDARKINVNDKKNASLMEAVYNTLFDTVFITYKQVSDFKIPKHVKLAVQISNVEEAMSLPADAIVVCGDRKILDELKLKKIPTAYYQKVDDKDSLDNSYQNAHLYDYLIIELVDETNIPLELILAKMQKNINTQVLKIVSTAEAAMITFGVMEVGSEGIILSTFSVEEVYKLSKRIEETSKDKLNLIDLEVVSIEHIGMGNRSCIDTNSLLDENEGMIIGSTSRGGILVCSETHYLPYMNLRPFRVNAGSISSYCWGPNNVAEYLSDLKAGSEVLAVSVEGKARKVSVGRIKTEVRPLLLITTKYKDELLKTIVQDDWHVRVMGAKGEIRNVTTLKTGEMLKGFVCETGRHVGIKVDETIYEK